MDFKGLTKALPVLFNSNVTPLIVGSHGIGKSQGIRQAIDGQGIGKTWDFRLGQMADTGDIIGLLDIESNKEYCTFKMPERIFEVIKYCNENPDKYGVMFFDEMNRTTKDILQAIFQIVLDNELNGVKFPPNMKSIAANNPATDDFDVLDFNDRAFADRFCHIKFEPSTKDWLSYARKSGIDSSIIDFIGEQNEFLKSETQDFTLQVDFTPRSWESLDRIKKNCNDQNVFEELAMGMIGREATGSYLQYLSKYDETIKAIDVLDNYKSVKDKVLRFSDTKAARTDILHHVAEGIKAELEKIEVMPKKWEKSLGQFFLDVPKDFSTGVLNTFFQVPSFLSTESDKEEGFSGGKFKESKKLLGEIKKWKDAEKVKNDIEITEDETNE